MYLKSILPKRKYVSRERFLTKDELQLLRSIWNYKDDWSYVERPDFVVDIEFSLECCSHGWN